MWRDLLKGLGWHYACHWKLYLYDEHIATIAVSPNRILASFKIYMCIWISNSISPTRLKFRHSCMELAIQLWQHICVSCMNENIFNCLICLKKFAISVFTLLYTQIMFQFKMYESCCYLTVWNAHKILYSS